MRYTITALSSSPTVITAIRERLLHLGATPESITIEPGEPDHSLNHISVQTDDLEQSERFRTTMKRASGHDVTTNEESSSDLTPVAPAEETLPTNPPDRIWQADGRWHVESRTEGITQSFATKDEAISFSRSTFTDGATAARAEAERGDVVPRPNPTQRNGFPA